MLFLGGDGWVSWGVRQKNCHFKRGKLWNMDGTWMENGWKMDGKWMENGWNMMEHDGKWMENGWNMDGT